MNDSTRRSIRTFLDVIVAVVAAFAVLVPVVGLDAETVAKVGVFVGALSVALTKLRNGLEDAGRIPALFKAPASDGAEPYPPADTRTIDLRDAP